MNPDILIQRLRQLPLERKLKIDGDKRRAKITCHYHRLDDGSFEKTPSFIINLQYTGKGAQGSGFCFACGRKIKHFEQIINPDWRPNEETPSEWEDERDESVQRLHNNYVDDILNGTNQKLYDLKAAMPWNTSEEWRGIPGALMQKIGAVQVFDDQFKILMAYLPCTLNGERVGGIRARLTKKKGSLSYVNDAGSWVKERGLFCYDTTKELLKRKNLDTVVIGEGPRDALRPLCYGIPTCSILGTQNWSDSKAELVYNLGIKRIITAFDPDGPGLKATQDVYASIRGEIRVQNFNIKKYQKQEEKRQGKPFEEPWDLGNLPLVYMKKLKQAVYGDRI